MQTIRLTAHPDTPPRSAMSVTVSVERKHGSIWLRFHTDIDLNCLAVPLPQEPNRTGGLWRTTCFEAFVRQPDTPAYSEFNLSPSSQWAAYRFTDYRAGMADLVVPSPLAVELDASESHLALECEVPFSGEDGASLLELSLTAVIEEIDGTKSYWAFAHPAGPPDFHDPACFTLALEPPTGE